MQPVLKGITSGASPKQTDICDDVCPGFGPLFRVIYNLLRPGRARYAAAFVLQFKGFYFDKAF